MKRNILLLISAILLATSCNYLDVVPKSKATENDIWKTAAQAKNYRYEMMSYMPNVVGYQWAPDQFCADDFTPGPRSTAYWYPGKSLLYNMDNPSQTYFGYWAPTARSGGTNYDMYRGIRYAYYFIDNIHNVPDISKDNADRFEGEAWFCIGYYHQKLLEYYGPCILVKRFIPFDSDRDDEIRPSRTPYDECVDFIAECYDKAAALLPETVIEGEWGLPCATAALAYKSRLLLTAASPLVNGNTDYAGFTNRDGTTLINQTYSKEKWKRAMDAAEAAITMAEHNNNFSLYHTRADATLSTFEQAKEDYRCAFTEQDWNGEEFIFAKGDAGSGIWNLQVTTTPRCRLNDQQSWRATCVPTFEAVQMFLSKNGLPMDVDPETKDLDLYSIAPGDSTVLMHRNREPRFYAMIGFDRGKFAFASTDITLYARAHELHGFISETTEFQSCTGYFCQKWARKQSYYDYEKRAMMGSYYAYPYLRLAELYLDYAEADFEYNGTLSAKGLEYLNKVRNRAGLPNFQDSWAIVGGMPSGDRLRSELHRERTIEFLFEGRRWFDIRRWKEAKSLLNVQMKAWNVRGTTAWDFYKVVDCEVEAQRQFDDKNYFLAIPQSEINKNPNLVQNPGY